MPGLYENTLERPSQLPFFNILYTLYEFRRTYRYVLHSSKAKLSPNCNWLKSEQLSLSIIERFGHNITRAFEDRNWPKPDTST